MFQLNRFVSLLALTAVAAIGCTDQKSQSLNTPAGQALVPPPAKMTELPFEMAVKRFMGQTEFLTPSISSATKARSAGAPESAMDTAAGGGGRAEQESDIFKIGRPGDKLLYLLNNYRGLQVVSFKNDVNKPELLGRVKATGNYPSDMYFDEKNNRLLVLENLWWESTATSETQSRVLVYDVSNPSKPRISQILDVQGTIRDSRLLTDATGGILYLATSVEPVQSWDQTQKTKGFVISVDIGDDQLKIVDTFQLGLPAVYGEQMNIQTTEIDGMTKYYLIAAQSESGWGGWWDRKSLVEVVDISNLNGKVSPVMTVSAKGFLSERSQTYIKDGFLLVTSNYQTESGNATSPTIFNVAVEAFALPAKGNDVIEASEGQFRELWLQRGLKGKTGAEYDEAYARMIADKEYGLKGRFVRNENGSLRKLVADSDVFYGDPTGLSASLQDVRYQDGLMYVFWVPSNQIDPFDIFDISDLKGQGVKKLYRNQFDGWVQKAIPMRLDGQNFVLGLGWEVINADRERRQQTPKAIIFKQVEGDEGEVEFKLVTEMRLSDSEVWMSFNAPDKYIEVKMSAPGKGEILFAADKYGKNRYISGAQIIGFDLNQIIAKNKKDALKEGAFLAGNSGWLRRVFSNPEIDRINTFSDKALGTFDRARVTKAGTVEAVSILELARNTSGYASILDAQKKPVGLQIISSDYWSWDGSDSVSEIRAVDTNFADAEKPATTGRWEMEGSVVDHWAGPDVLLVMTQKSYYEKVEGQDQYRTKYIVTQFRMKSATEALVSKVEWVENSQQVLPFTFDMDSYSRSGAGFVRTPSGQLIANTYYSVRAINMGAEVSTSEINMADCAGVEPGNESSRALKLVSNQLVLLEKNMVTYKGAYMWRHMLTPVTLDGSKLTCSAAINIPGEPVMIKGDYVLADDIYAVDTRLKMVQEEGQPDTEMLEMQTRRGLTAVSLKDGKATLVDQQESSSNGWSSLTEGFIEMGGKLVKIEGSNAEENNVWPMHRVWDEMPWRGDDQTPSPHLKVLDLVGGNITSEQFHFDTELKNAIMLKKAWSVEGGYMALIGGGREMQMVKWTAENMRPEVMKVSVVDEQGARLEPSTRISTGTYYYGGDVNYNAALNSVEVSTGMGGILQFFIP